MRQLFNFLIVLFLLSGIHLGNTETLTSSEETDGDVIPKLQSLLAPDSVSVRPNEPLILTATIKNLGPHGFRVLKEGTVHQCYMGSNSWICELKKDGEEYLGWNKFHHYVYPRPPKRRDTKVIRTGEMVSSEFDLNDWYPIYAPGKYQVRAVYVQGPNPDVGIRKVPPVYSNWITVIVE